MELFLIYLVTRLSDLKEGLHGISILAGVLLGAVLAARVLNEFVTSTEVKEKAAVETDPKKALSTDVFVYLGIRRSTKRGLWFFTPVFVLVFCINLFLPTTRDAVVIAGGYGLVEAVKNERVQRLFAKSAKVASQWLEAQLNGEDKKAGAAAAPASAASASDPPASASK